MKTCGMTGEVVGKAASVAIRHDTTPRGVSEKHEIDAREIDRDVAKPFEPGRDPPRLGPRQQLHAEGGEADRRPRPIEGERIRIGPLAKHVGEHWHPPRGKLHADPGAGAWFHEQFDGGVSGIVVGDPGNASGFEPIPICRFRRKENPFAGMPRGLGREPALLEHEDSLDVHPLRAAET